jgi:general L-amino acid transport system substrate-binding protein
MIRRTILSMLAAAGLAVGVSSAAQAGATLDAVRQRGTLSCGVNVGIAGFSLPDSQGIWRGMDADLCRGVAAALFGDPTKVRFVPLTAVQRFMALQSGEIGVLIRQTTMTLVHDTNLGMRMVHPYLYDGHGFMVRRDSNVRTIRGMNGMTVCLSPGTTNEMVTTDAFRTAGAQFRPVLQERMQDNAQAMQAGRCDAIGTDATQLAALRSQFSQPNDFVILEERFSKEPYGPVVRRDDQEWFDVIRWVVFGLIEAEELGVISQNAEQMRATSQNPSIRRLLGVTPDLSDALKLRPSWMFDVLRAIGNYGELYERTIGPSTPLGLPRGNNDLWTRGRLMYAWPLR